MITDRHLFLVPPLAEKPVRPRPTRSLTARPWRIAAAVDDVYVDNILKPILFVSSASRDTAARGQVIPHARTAREALDLLAWTHGCYDWCRWTAEGNRGRPDLLGSGVLRVLRAHGLSLDEIAAGLAAAQAADPWTPTHHLFSDWCFRPGSLARLDGEADGAYAARIAATPGCLHWWNTTFSASEYDTTDTTTVALD